MPITCDSFNNASEASLPKHLGISALHIATGICRLRLPIKPQLLAINGYLHAGSVVTLADTSAGVGCMASYPEGVESFTTIELKSNFLGTCREGAIIAEARLLHGGRSTQVWDASVSDESNGKIIAHFRCTQMLLYPR